VIDAEQLADRIARAPRKRRLPRRVARGSAPKATCGPASRGRYDWHPVEGCQPAPKGLLAAKLNSLTVAARSHQPSDQEILARVRISANRDSQSVDSICTIFLNRINFERCRSRSLEGSDNPSSPQSGACVSAEMQTLGHENRASGAWIIQGRQVAHCHGSPDE
jgi:hypothetical protein